MRLQFRCHIDRMAADLKIQVIRKKSIELDAQQPSLGQQGSSKHMNTWYFREWSTFHTRRNTARSTQRQSWKHLRS